MPGKNTEIDDTTQEWYFLGSSRFCRELLMEYEDCRGCEERMASSDSGSLEVTVIADVKMGKTQKKIELRKTIMGLCSECRGEREREARMARIESGLDDAFEDATEDQASWIKEL